MAFMTFMALFYHYDEFLHVLYMRIVDDLSFPTIAAHNPSRRVSFDAATLAHEQLRINVSSYRLNDLNGIISLV